MGTKRRKEIRFRARQKRRKRRARLKAAGKDPNGYYYSGIYVGGKE